MTENLKYAPGEIRDRLANERTLLSWVRTALSLIAFGVGLAKFSMFLRLFAVQASIDPTIHIPPPGYSRLIGAGLIVLGGIVMLIGAHRSHVWADTIDPGLKPPNNFPLAATSAVTIAVSAVLACYILLF